MKNFLLALVFMFTTSCFNVRPEPTTNFNFMLNSTAALVEFSSRDLSYHVLCAGVFISETQILTAAHCVTRVRQATAAASYDVIEFVEIATYSDFNLNHDVTSTHIFVVENINSELDLALLQTVGDISPGEFEIATITELNYPSVGTEVFSVGHPLEVVWNISPGIVSARQSMMGPMQLVHASTNSYFGSSGGPLFSRNGEVLGIAHAILFRQSWLPLFIGPRSIRSFLESVNQEN